jgi:hypothetical protein
VSEHVVVAVGDATRGIEEPQPEGQVVGSRDEDCVCGELDQSMPVDKEPLHASSTLAPTMPPL